MKEKQGDDNEEEKAQRKHAVPADKTPRAEQAQASRTRRRRRRRRHGSRSLYGHARRDVTAVPVEGDGQALRDGAKWPDLKHGKTIRNPEPPCLGVAQAR